MPGRKKRTKKGIGSLMKQIDEHEAKLEKAKESGNIGLAEYYEKEIAGLRRSLGRKQAIVERGK